MQGRRARTEYPKGHRAEEGAIQALRLGRCPSSFIFIVVLALLLPSVGSAAPIIRDYEIINNDRIAMPGPPTPNSTVGGPVGAGLAPIQPSVFVECGGFGIGCIEIQPSGTIRFAPDLEAGTATLDLARVMTETLTGVNVGVTGENVLDLFFGLEEVVGFQLAVALPGTHWQFNVEQGGRSVFIDVSELGDILTIRGGYDDSPLDGPSARIDVVAQIVPEPSLAILMGIGLAGLARGGNRTRSNADSRGLSG